MNARNMLDRALVAAVVLGLGVIACRSDESKTRATAIASVVASADASPPAAKKDDVKKEGDVTAKAGVDAKALLESGDKEESAALPVDLDGIKNDAPTIATKPPAGGINVTWIDAGSDSIPSFGFKKEEAKDLLYLEAPDKTGGVVFTTFKDPAEGTKRVAEIVSQLKLKDIRWKKPKPIVLATDKIPALIGAGHGTDSEGNGVKVVYAFVKGEPNLLGIAGVSDSAPQSVQDEVFATIGGIKRKPN